MVNENEDVFKEEQLLENGKSVIRYIKEDGTPSSKFKATFMCEYIYNNEGVLVSTNISNNPHYIDESKAKEVKLNRVMLHLSDDTLDKLNKLAISKNMGKSEFITHLINNLK